MKDHTPNHLESYKAYLKNLKDKKYDIVSEKKKPSEIIRVEKQIKKLKENV